MAWFLAVILFATLQCCITLPRRNLEGHFIGEGSNDLATSILKGYDHESSNFVFSPLGYSTILAILAEGAVGRTREEIVSTLKFPADNELIRGTFKTVLQRMTDKETLNKPEFKTYFYIYKNITVKDDYKRILLENYLTEVKSVDRPDEEGVMEISYESSTEVSEGSIDEELVAEEKLKKSSTLYPLLSQETVTEKASMESAEETKTKEKTDAEKDKMSMEKEKMGAEKDKMSMEKDKMSMESEKMSMEKDKMGMEKDKMGMEKDKMAMEKDKMAMEKDKMSMEKDKMSMEKEKMGMEKEKMDAEKEKMDAERKRIEAEKSERILRLAKKFLGINLRQRRFSGPQQLMGISANQLGSKHGRDIQSKMIVFNGLYFKGSFVTPFTSNKNQTDGLFYASEKEKLPAEMMNALGNFQYGELTDLDAKAIELPYEGGRYSLLILLPKTRGGLSKLVSDLSGYSLRNIHKQMALHPVSVRLPKFDFRAISKPVSILKKSGISSIFSSDADLSGLSPDEGLFLNELVQLVTIKVDEDTSSTNLFTASALSLRSIYSVKFNADHPFLFFLRDSQENIIISAGKIANPSEKAKC